MSTPAINATPELGARAKRAVLRPSFFLWMSLLMNLYVFGGFGLSYFLPLARSSFPPAPPVVHLHAAMHFLWMILLTVQPLLVNIGKTSLHRSLGNLGIAVGTSVFFTGALLALLAAASTRDTPVPPYYDLVYLGVWSVTGFGILFALAIWQVRRPEVHKRLILLATLPLLPPAVNRMYMVPFGMTDLPLLPMYLTLDAMALAIVFQEWRATRRVGPYSIFAVVLLVSQQLLHVPVTESGWFAGFVYELTGMMRYR
jgi:hypothetical protein